MELSCESIELWQPQRKRGLSVSLKSKANIDSPYNLYFFVLLYRNHRGLKSYTLSTYQLYQLNSVWTPLQQRLHLVTSKYKLNMYSFVFWICFTTFHAKFKSFQNCASITKWELLQLSWRLVDLKKGTFIQSLKCMESLSVNFSTILS